MATAIASALNSSLRELFPGLPSSGSRPKKAKREKGEPPVSKDAFWKVGIDADPRNWTIKVGFVGGKEFFYRVDAKEKERISSIVWAPPLGFDFIVFDTRTHRVAINRTMINYCNFLFDMGVVEATKESIDYHVTVHFIGSEEPVSFGVEPDQIDTLEDDQGWASQVQSLMIDLDGKGADEDDILHFDDGDGERVYLRSRQIVCLQVPLLCCEPALWNAYVENDDEDDSDGEDESVTEAPDAGNDLSKRT